MTIISNHLVNGFGCLFNFDSGLNVPEWVPVLSSEKCSIDTKNKIDRSHFMPAVYAAFTRLPVFNACRYYSPS